MGILVVSTWTLSEAIGRFGAQVDTDASTLRAALAASLVATTPVPDKDRVQMQRDVFQTELTARAAQLQAHVSAVQVLVQAVGSTALLIGLWFTWENLRVTHAALATTRRSQHTDRFARAVEHLASNDEGTRLAGIFALEELAHLDENLYWPAIQMLTSHLKRPQAGQTRDRLESLVPPHVEPRVPPTHEIARVEVRAIMNALRYRLRARETRDDQILDLTGTNLTNIDLSGIHLENALMENAHFDGAVMLGAHLMGAKLRGATFVGTVVTDADFKDADIEGAAFAGAIGLDRARNLPSSAQRG